MSTLITHPKSIFNYLCKSFHLCKALKMKHPDVSIIIPVYNRPDFIATAIKAIQIQTHLNWELIIVDDISTDNTVDVISLCKRTDDRINLLIRNRGPKGPSTCKNIGAEHATGKYLLFWDSDDIMFPWCIKNRLAFMKNNNDLDFAFFQLLDYRDKNNIFLLCNIIGLETHVEKFINFSHGGGTPTVLWKKDSFYNTGGWNEETSLWEDAELHIRAIHLGLKHDWGSHIPDGIVINTDRPDRLTSNKNAKQKAKSILTSYVLIRNNTPVSLKQKFKENVQKKLWGKFFLLNFSNIKELAEKAINIGLFTKKEYKEVLNFFFIYQLISKIPLLRRPLYYSKAKNHSFKIHSKHYTITEQQMNEISIRINNLEHTIYENLYNLVPSSIKKRFFKL